MRALLPVTPLLFILAIGVAADPGTAPQTAPPSSTAAGTTAAPASPAAETAKKAPSPTPAETKPKADAKKSPADVRKISDTHFKQCMQDWDAATHMTRKEWERTCRRVVRARVKFMLEQMD